VQTHPHPCLVSRVVSLCVFRPSDSCRLSSSHLFLSVSSIHPARFLRTVRSSGSRRPAQIFPLPAGGLPLTPSQFWSCYSTFRRSVACRFRPSCIIGFILLSDFLVSCPVVPVGRCPVVSRASEVIYFRPYCLLTETTKVHFFHR
jgi:hypothetical protein